MKALRNSILTIIGVISMACTPKSMPLPDPVIMDTKDLTLQAESLFYQSQYITNALSLVPRESDGLLVFGFNTGVSSANCRYPAPEVRITSPNQAVSTDIVAGGQYETPFRLEIPMTLEPLLPKAFVEVESVRINGAFFLSLTLSPDFPFTKAWLENPTITFPSWIDSENYRSLPNHQLRWEGSTVKPGQVMTWQTRSEKEYVLQEGEGFREEDRQLVMDNTIVFEGTIRVEEADRKNPAEKGFPWSATFLTGWRANGGEVSSLMGRMDLKPALKDQILTFSRIPDFFKREGLVFDLEDLHGEVRVKNQMQTSLAVSGVLTGDEREYPFGSENGRPPVWVPVGKGDYHIFFSEKGGRVKDDGQTDRIDIPTQGFSGLIDGDPLSFGLRDIRIKNDPQQSFRFNFDQDYWITVQGRISSSMMVGKDFGFQTMALVAEIPESKADIVKITGTFHVTNSFPFDYEILPFFYDRKYNRIPIRLETIRVPAGERGKPADVPVDFNWESSTPVSARFLLLELNAHTGKGREGESLYKDQQLYIGEASFNVY